MAESIIPNTLNDKIGSLSNLETTTKTNVVAAINEVKSTTVSIARITTGTFTCSPADGVVNVTSNYSGTIPTVGHVVFTPYNFTTDRGALDFYFDEGGKLYCYSNKTLGTVSVRWIKYTP